MGESNDLFFENVLSKNTDEDISTNINPSDTSEKSSASTIWTSTILKTEKYIDKIYDERVKSEQKRVILLELQHIFSRKKRKRTPWRISPKPQLSNLHS